MRQITRKYERATALLLQLTIMCVVFAHGQDDVLFTILQPAPLRSAKLFAGASLPLGEFGDNDPTANNGGFAYPGFAAGFEYMHELTHGFGFAVTAMANINGQDGSRWKEEIPFFSYNTSLRQIGWLLGGIMLNSHLSRWNCVYACAEAGLAYANYPELEVTDAYGYTLTIDAPAASAIAYKLGIGAKMRRIDVGLQFLYSYPEYHPTYQVWKYSGNFSPEKRPVKVLQLTIGYVLNRE